MENEIIVFCWFLLIQSEMYKLLISTHFKNHWILNRNHPITQCLWAAFRANYNYKVITNLCIFKIVHIFFSSQLDHLLTDSNISDSSEFQMKVFSLTSYQIVKYFHKNHSVLKCSRSTDFITFFLFWILKFNILHVSVYPIFYVFCSPYTTNWLF